MNLTGRSYSLSVIIILLGILAEWGLDELAPVWRLLAAALLLGLLIEGLLARNLTLRVQRQLPGAAYLGNSFDYKLRLHNPLDLPLTVRSMESLPALVVEQPPEMHWHIASDQSQTQTCRVTPTHLGKLHWNSIQLRLLGRFGLAWWSRKLSQPDVLDVVPDRLHASEYKKTATEHQGDISRQITGTGHELIGLREYHYGDPLHFIDWKATARTRKPIVRLFSDEQRLELILAIDAGRTSGIQAGVLTRLGHYTNIAARLAEKAIHNGDQVGLVVFADQITHQIKGLRGHRGLQHLRNTLQQIQTIPRESNPLAAILQIRALATHRSLIVLLTDLDDGDAAIQLVNAMRLLRPKHQPVVGAIADSGTVQLQHQEIRDWADPFQSLAATEMIQNWEHTRYKLQRMGIPVVLATNEHIDSQILSSYDRMKLHRRV